MVLLLFGSMDAMAAIEQAIQVKGKVVDNIGEPVIGANVVVKGTTTGVITSIDGSFAIDAVKGSTIVVSFIGYLSQEVKVTGNFLNITLENNTELLDEVVVVGYGVQKKANLTGAIATVGAKELEDRPVTNAAAALQGKVANLNISNGDGGPGKKASFNIRGYAGLDATYSPLVIIDGVTGYFDDLNPNDIETLTVLKDAAASAIYGAQAAYGVILLPLSQVRRMKRLSSIITIIFRSTVRPYYPKQPVHWSFPDFLEKLTSMEAVVVLLTWRRWNVLKNITMIRPVFPTTCRNEIIRTVGLIGETDVQMPTKTGKKLCLRITS